MEKFIRMRKTRITTDADVDKRILDDSFAAMDETVGARSVHGKPGLRKVIGRGRITRITATVIVIAITLMVGYRNRDRQIEPPRVAGAAKSPAELLTALSIKIAYRRGGIEAVDRQYQRAFEMLGPKNTSISVEQLSADLDSVQSVRDSL